MSRRRIPLHRSLKPPAVLNLMTVIVVLLVLIVMGVFAMGALYPGDSGRTVGTRNVSENERVIIQDRNGETNYDSKRDGAMDIHFGH